jgi:mono/diheme cytochrome c family protein
MWPGYSQAAPPHQVPDTKPSASAGSVLWQENCLPCHGPTGQGDGPAAQAIDRPIPGFADPEFARQLAPAGNFDVIKNGRIENLMPPWGNRFDDPEIWDLTAHVWRLSTTSTGLAAGVLVYDEQCAVCHGEDGTGKTADAPAEMIDFTDLPVMVERSQADLQAGYTASTDHAELSDLSAEELWQSLDYVRTFSFAVPQPNGVLSGQVINNSTNQPVGDLHLTLHVVDGEVEIETLTARTDPAGFYSFSNLPTEHSILYFVEGRYQDVPYFSEAGLFVPDSNQAELDLNVYDTTTSREAVELTRLNYLLSFTPDTLNVVQLFMTANSGNETYVGQNGQTLAFDLPDVATNVVFQNDSEGRFIETDSGYIDTQPVLPGEQQNIIAVIYEIPLERDSLSFDVPIPADLASINVLMRAQGADLASEQLEFVETRQFEGSDFSFFSGANLNEGDEITLEFAGLNDLEFDEAQNQLNSPGGAVAVPTPIIDQNQISWILVGLGGLAIGCVGLVYPHIRPQLNEIPVAHGPDPALRKQKILLLLVYLDEAFEDGQLNEQVYRQTRAKYKAELANLMELEA